MSDMQVQPRGSFNAEMAMPGDKSISHRIAMAASLAEGVSRISGFLDSGDCLDTLEAVRRLGAGVERNGTDLSIAGVAGRYRAPGETLDLGNSGTGMRLLAGLVAGQEGLAVEMTGDESLRSRPMGRIKEPLERMGARIELTGPRGCAPLRIVGGRLAGIEYELPVASAQVKTCVLFAGLFAGGRTTVIEPRPTRDHTERMLLACGVPVTVQGNVISVAGSAGKAPGIMARDWRVPGDFSAAAFWITAAACSKGARLRIADVGLNPTRTGLLNVLRRMGADITTGVSDNGGGRPAWEPVGCIEVNGRSLRGTEVRGNEIPNVIDELPLVALAGAMADGATVIEDAAELRVKESDRIEAVAGCLKAAGVDVEERSDGMIIHGGRGIRGGCVVDSRGDHRIAMMMAVAGLVAGQTVTIRNTDCIATSYPRFRSDLERL